MSEWDATTYEGKPTILRVVREQAGQLLELAGPPEAWERRTACEKWAVRDVVGHLIDTTEGYFQAFETARAGAEPGAPIGLPAMHSVAGERATGFRELAQAEALDRLRTDLDGILKLLDEVGPDDWGAMIVPHAYMGPVPAFFYAAGQLMDYAVHGWDIREGAGQCHALDGEAADLLVPFMFVLWQYTIRPDADLSPFQVGVRVTSGHNAGEFQVSISPDGMAYEPGSLDDAPCVLEFDAGSLVLTTFGRCNAGSVRGDGASARRFLSLFFRI